MLRLRLVRIGKKKQPFFRIVAAEHSKAVQGKFIEVVGNYNPVSKDLKLNKERITHWLSKGAQPTDSAAVLFKQDGIPDMDKFILPREKKKMKKKEAKEEAKKEASAPSAPKAEEAKSEEATPAVEKAEEAAETSDEPKEEAPAEEPKEETPAEEDKPAEEKPE